MKITKYELEEWSLKLKSVEIEVEEKPKTYITTDRGKSHISKLDCDRIYKKYSNFIIYDTQNKPFDEIIKMFLLVVDGMIEENNNKLTKLLELKQNVKNASK